MTREGVCEPTAPDLTLLAPNVTVSEAQGPLMADMKILICRYTVPARALAWLGVVQCSTSRGVKCRSVLGQRTLAGLVEAIEYRAIRSRTIRVPVDSRRTS